MKFLSVTIVAITCLWVFLWYLAHIDHMNMEENILMGRITSLEFRVEQMEKHIDRTKKHIKDIYEF